MDKKEIGLPGSFALSVEKPVELGGYLELDAERSAPRLRRSKVRAVPEETQASNGQEAPTERAEGSAERVRKSYSKRKQVNMTPEALARLHELVTLVRERTVQEDAAASEVMDAIISVVYDARFKLSLSQVAPRGRW